jgi:alkyl hydroperoxide reductase subunit AhpC
VIELLRIIESIQYVKKNPGQACPANYSSIPSIDIHPYSQMLYSHPLKSKLYFRDFYASNTN